MSESEVLDDAEVEERAPEALPLDAWHRAHGGRMVPFAGYWMPVQFDGIVAEHEWTRNSASLFDVSHMGQLAVTGAGAAQALEALLPGDIAGLGEGQMRYSMLLDESGGILDDLMVTHARPGEYFLVVNGAMKWDDIAHLREYLPDDIALNVGDDRALFALQGPKAVEALSALVPGVTDLSFMEHGLYPWGDYVLGISRSGYTGEDGFEISVRVEDAEKLADALLADERVKPAGLGARDSLRLEAGLPLYGHDLTPETDPVSASLLFALSKNRRASGGWMGHGAVAKVLADGPATKRVGLSLEGRLPAREGAEIFAGDAKIGTVTSGGFSPTLGHPVAMGYVAAAQSAPGTALEIEVRGKRLPATVVKLPFVPHRYHRKGAA